jgi:hypothetical protein
MKRIVNTLQEAIYLTFSKFDMSDVVIYMHIMFIDIIVDCSRKREVLSDGRKEYEGNSDIVS